MWPFDRKRKKLEKEKLEQQQKAMSNPHQNQMQPSRSANLRDADLRSADLPSPTMVLLANWSGKLSAQLTADLMEYDASCHPDRDAFTKWANGGDCPYASVHVQRAANFKEIKELWGTGKPCGAYSLMLRLFSEKEIKVNLPS